MATKPSNLFIICILGIMSVITPFSIDLYLPAFPQAAKDLGVETAMIPLTLSSYFIGLSLGQIFYGPLLDRFGRKKPLCIGLIIFVAASIGCAESTSLYMLVAMRFLQALGACAAQVASLAMVRDFFKPEEGAVILSRLFLFIAVSPLLAPSAGNLIIAVASWRILFFLLAAIVAAILALVLLRLPEAHEPDDTISLKPLPIIKEYYAILRHPRFITYALAGAFSFAGLFTYIAGSPIIFMEEFRVSSSTYSKIFAGLATGFIVASQVNGYLLRRFGSQDIFIRAIIVQVITGVIFVVGSWQGLYELKGTLVLLFIFIACIGFTYPNAAALALSPFAKNAGSAAALLGFLQLGIGSLISTFISLSPSKNSFPIIFILGVTVGYQHANIISRSKKSGFSGC